MNISVIIPIHEYNKIIQGYLTKAVDSIVKQEDITEQPQIIIVAPQDVLNNIIYSNFSGVTTNILFIKNNDETNYQSQVNLAVKSVTTDYFSVLEFDDEYSTTYFRNLNKYIKSYPKIDVFLTMMIEVNNKDEGVKFTNETVWAQQFVGENGEIGYLNANALKQYTDFKLSGAVIKKSDFENIGGYKSNIKLTFMYEYLLRSLNNASIIYTIPKIGYKHLVDREGSLFNNYLINMPVEERKFWFETATKESNFTNDRPIDLSKLLKVVKE